MSNATTGPATAADFAKWERHAKTLDTVALYHVVDDCSEAAEAMAVWNPEREGFYRDQAMTYWAELKRRG